MSIMVKYQQTAQRTSLMKRVLNRKLRIIYHEILKHRTKITVLMVAMMVIPLSAPTASAASGQGAFITPKSKTSTPPGAANMCSQYRWACSSKGVGRQDSKAVLKLAKTVNNNVNRSTRQIDDIIQYGKEDHWVLPSFRGGDCEDMVLLKKKKLIQKGVASESLLIATVLDLNRNSHAVLVLRTQKGDYVLDSLRSGVISWRSTGYTFLKMQNPKSMYNWNAILAGGLIQNLPTAKIR
jgi:predicted transglutaminase-like cysteine proteinase